MLFTVQSPVEKMIEREADIERKLRDYVVKKRKGMCLKMNPVGFRGIPDRLVLLPGAEVHFIELKKKGERPRKNQYHWMKKLRELGFSAFWTDDYERCVKKLEATTKPSGSDPLDP